MLSYLWHKHTQAYPQKLTVAIIAIIIIIIVIRAGNGSLELTHDPLTHLTCDP